MTLDPRDAGAVRLQAHAEPWQSACRAVGVDPVQGLGEPEAHHRLQRYGANRLREPETRSAWAILVSQLRSLIIALLTVAALLSFLWARNVEGLAVAVVIALNTLLGFVTELRAIRSMEALRSLGDVEATVRRNGELRKIPARNIVVGDVLIVEAGDRITADARLLDASRLAADESTLTGESVPVGKGTASVAPEAALAERSSMLFKGTAITRGAGEAVVVATGQSTVLGETASLVEEVDDVETPLERRLSRLGRQLMWVSLLFALVIGLSGFVAGRDPVLIVETAIALAVATVPEGLPVVATLALARGMWRMARKNALVDELSAVETLGSTSLIITDKTGTLTENRMTVSRLVTAERAAPRGSTDSEAGAPGAEGELLSAAALCNDASLGSPRARDGGDDATERSDPLGDPMEVALLIAAREAGIERGRLLARYPEVRQEAFDPLLKMMATVHRDGDRFRYAVKGAPESVLPRCTRLRRGERTEDLDDEARSHWDERGAALAKDGQRLLAVATKHSASRDDDAYADLTLLGLIALRDPPRPGVRDAIARCRSAGVRLVMATGDQAATASSIARAVALVDEEPRLIRGDRLEGDLDSSDVLRRLLAADVVARCTPRTKLHLLSAHQQAGETVAMLGDGINDAPALRKADIGVAMGRRGTQVAREAADMVLLDDEMATVVMAIEQGRIIFDNIRNFVVYLLSCNLSEILIVGIASAAQAPLPLLPLQILFLNLVTDVFPALALAAGEGAPSVMSRAPRPRSESVLSRRHWASILAYGGLLTGLTLASLAVALRWLGFDESRAVTVSFLTTGFTQLAHVFNLADPTGPRWSNEVTKNRAVWGALALCTVLLLAATYAPGLSEVLRARDPGFEGWAVVAAAVVATLLGAHLLRRLLASTAGGAPVTRET